MRQELRKRRVAKAGAKVFMATCVRSCSATALGRVRSVWVAWQFSNISLTMQAAATATVTALALARALALAPALAPAPALVVVVAIGRAQRHQLPPRRRLTESWRLPLLRDRSPFLRKWDSPAPAIRERKTLCRPCATACCTTARPVALARRCRLTGWLTSCNWNGGACTTS